MTGLNLVGTVEENISLAALDRVARFGVHPQAQGSTPAPTSTSSA